MKIQYLYMYFHCVGEKHRNIRKEIKKEAARLKKLGWNENELGELKHTSKTKTRRNFVLSYYINIIQEKILKVLQNREYDNICAIEDVNFIKILEVAEVIES